MKSIGPIIEKTEAFIISEIFKLSEISIVYIGKDDREIINIYKKLCWLLPKEKILLYKAWDQIPYDNISPSKDVQSSRLETLYYLDTNRKEKKIILTTINAIIQKTLPKFQPHQANKLWLQTFQPLIFFSHAWCRQRPIH